MSAKNAEGKGVMWKIIGAKECSKIENFGVDAKEGERRKWHGLERQKCSKAMHGQETRKAQLKRRVTKGRSGEPSEC